MNNNIFFKLFYGSAKQSDQYFLEHNKKYTRVMEELTQTTKQEEEFYAEIVKANYYKSSIGSEKILNSVTIVNTNQRAVAESFLSSVHDVQSKLKIKNYKGKLEQFKPEFTALQNDASKFQALSKSHHDLCSTAISENPFFADGVRALGYALEKGSIPILTSLIQYSDRCELLVSMSAAQTVSVVVGCKLTAQLHRSFAKPGSFKLYLTEVRNLAFSVEQPFVDRCYKILAPCAPYAAIVLTGFVGYQLRGPLSEATTDITKAIRQSIGEKYIPNVDLRATAEKNFSFIAGIGYTCGRALASARDGMWAGLWGQTLSDSKEIITKTIKEVAMELKKK